MEWTSETGAGDWLRERIDDPWDFTMHDIVPRGYAAYARIFHPASVQFLPGERMPSLAAWREMEWREHEPLMERIVHEPVTWQQAADAFGTVLHPLAQWNGIVRAGTTDPNGWQQTDSPDGRWFDAPLEGELPQDLLPVIARHLAAHTTTPNAGCAALWDGYGGLLGHLGQNPSRVFFQIGDPADATLDHHNRMLGSATKDVFNNVFRRDTWQEGILSREISEGPRFELPGRAHVLFRGGVSELADAEWMLRVPWRDRPAEAHGFDPSALTPSILWPDDHAWTLVTEVDYDSTIIAGSLDLVRALCADPLLEAYEIAEGAVLHYGSDEVNR